MEGQEDHVEVLQMNAKKTWVRTTGGQGTLSQLENAPPEAGRAATAGIDREASGRVDRVVRQLLSGPASVAAGAGQSTRPTMRCTGAGGGGHRRGRGIEVDLL